MFTKMSYPLIYIVEEVNGDFRTKEFWILRLQLDNVPNHEMLNNKVFKLDLISYVNEFG